MCFLAKCQEMGFKTEKCSNGFKVKEFNDSDSG